MASASRRIEVERIQAGVRGERRIVKVHEASAEYRNMTFGDLPEGVVFRAFAGKAPFSAETLHKIGELRGIYDLRMDARAGHHFREKS
jgi:hypothetical protein